MKAITLLPKHLEWSWSTGDLAVPCTLLVISSTSGIMPDTSQLPLLERIGVNQARSTPTSSWLPLASTGHTLDSTVR